MSPINNTSLLPILFYLSFQSVPESIDSVAHIKDNIPLQKLKVDEISDVPPEKVNTEELLLSDMASAPSDQEMNVMQMNVNTEAVLLSDMASASSDQKDHGTELHESLVEHLRQRVQERVQEVESLKKELERVKTENKLLATFLRNDESLESSNSQNE